MQCRIASQPQESNDEDSNASTSDDEENNVDGTAQAVEVDNAVLENENLMLKAAAHVKSAIAQRNLANNKVQQAIDDMLAEVPHQQRTYTFIADYCQNFGLPYFGSEQPGETYYFSPLNVNCFGVVDVTLNNHLHAFVYDEGTGKKGGNNVASLLMKLFESKGLLNHPDGPCEEIVVIMDNCSGQNKNRMVLRLAPYLVEMNFCKKMKFCFLVRGHTKNACDRMFNILKQHARRSNVYTLQCLLDAFNKSKDVTAIQASRDDFFNWDDFLDMFYKRFTTGSVLRGHIFESEMPSIEGANQSASIRIIDSDVEGSYSLTQNLFKNINHPWLEGLTREEALASIQPNVIDAPSIKEIKQCELYLKWRKFVPTIFQDNICPKPSDEILNRNKEIKREKAQKRNPFIEDKEIGEL